MTQVDLKYNAGDPEGQWQLIRDDVAAADADLVATQSRLTDELLLGTPPPGPTEFQGVRLYLEFYAASDPETVIVGGTWSMQLIEAAILPVIEVENPVRVIGGEVVTAIPSLAVETVGGWRIGAISVRIAALAFPVTADRARVYIREF